MEQSKKYALAMLSASSLIVGIGATQTAYADNNIGIVTASSLNVRSGPSTSDSIIGGLKKGEEVQLISSSNGWYQIKYSNKDAWVSEKYISIKNTSNSTDDTTTNKTLVATANLNVRSGGSTDYKIISYIKKGQSVEVIGTASTGWYKVKLSNNTIGYASNKYLVENTTADSSNNTSSNGSTSDTVIEALITTANLNVRSGPSTENSIIGYLSKGTSVSIIEHTSASWYKVKLSNGKIGYCSSKYLASKNEDDSVTTQKPSTSEDVLYSMEVKSYAYYTGSITATGTKPTAGRTIAVDPTVIPYGTKIYIPEFDKVFIAEDCGGGIKGNKVDIFMNTKEECINWGVRNITIYILK